MDEVKNLLTVTLVVMAAGSSIYTIKTYMKPGMDLNINLEESGQLDEVPSTNDSTTLQPTFDTLLASLTTESELVVENNTIAFEILADSTANKS